ncbi:hypothetical protein [Solirubrum puertoriconensis]|uniref:Uncharacterized protein n=1 Tax=Solirubrum puertoriconensis TaxID=1751427 RepID=A0A9X0HLN3_SOLP1|nr:hypothetical protein [Solirubrum puertoriconensis]KUG08247.1 hypothetical protein ASU33_08670 [Solirubrum puertoriconensis]
MDTEHWLRLVLFFVGWFGCSGVAAQPSQRALFPRMPRYVSFSPRIIKGVLPESSGLQASNSAVRVVAEPFQRNGKRYWHLDLYYDNKATERFTLRQRGDTVYAAVDTHMTEWNAEAAVSRLHAFQRAVRQLHEQDPRRMPPPPPSVEENVLFRFDARVGEEWGCFTEAQSSIQYYRISLEQIVDQEQAEPLYVFALRYSMSASHLPTLQKLVVSKTKGIRGMLWYDYACWEPYDCEDLLVRYGKWE